jgi:hypothetical protein
MVSSAAPEQNSRETKDFALVGSVSPLDWCHDGCAKRQVHFFAPGKKRPMREPETLSMDKEQARNFPSILAFAMRELDAKLMEHPFFLLGESCVLEDFWLQLHEAVE